MCYPSILGGKKSKKETFTLLDTFKTRNFWILSLMTKTLPISCLWGFSPQCISEDNFALWLFAMTGCCGGPALSLNTFCLYYKNKLEILIFQTIKAMWETYSFHIIWRLSGHISSEVPCFQIRVLFLRSSIRRPDLLGICLFGGLFKCIFEGFSSEYPTRKRGDVSEHFVH